MKHGITVKESISRLERRMAELEIRIDKMVSVDFPHAMKLSGRSSLLAGLREISHRMSVNEHKAGEVYALVDRQNARIDELSHSGNVSELMDLAEQVDEAIARATGRTGRSSAPLPSKRGKK